MLSNLKQFDVEIYLNRNDKLSFIINNDTFRLTTIDRYLKLNAGVNRRYIFIELTLIYHIPEEEKEKEILFIFLYNHVT